MKSLLVVESSLWASWIKEYAFQGVDFWHIDSKPHFNWCIRKLLKLRGMALPLFASGNNGALRRVKDIWDSTRVRKDKVAWHKLESRTHLFFECCFSRGIWASILRLCALVNDLMCWADELDWTVAFLKGRSLLVHILKLAWGAFVYFIWRERNHRVYRGEYRSDTFILNCIKDVINIKMQNRNIRLENVNRSLCDAWKIPIGMDAQMHA
ncbi:hypothetical protein GQ457_07G002460 [Hibiscus cannabinus]